MYTCLTWLDKYWCYLEQQYEYKGKEAGRTTDVCYAQKIARNRYLTQFFLFITTVSFTIIKFSYRLFILEASLPRGICVYISSPHRNRLHKLRSSKIFVLVALSFLLSITITITVFSPFDYIQVQLAYAQQDTNNNNSNNTKFVSLSTISTVIGTGAAATGAIVTVPGVMKTRKQSKFLATYLLKIHNKYDELCRKAKTKPTDQNKNEYQDFLETLRCDIIYLLQNGSISENHYKMLDDRITEYLGRIKTQKT
jgi:hypothetical protein